MDINVAELRNKTQINWMVPQEWMTKLTDEDIRKWEAEAIEEAKQKILSENRPINPEENPQKFRAEIAAIVNDKARLINLDYKKIVF